MTVIGVASDLDMAELLFTSLRAQATAAMILAGRVVDANGRSRTRSFRHAFLHGYARASANGCAPRREAAVADARHEHGDAAVLPVLSRRAPRRSTRTCGGSSPTSSPGVARSATTPGGGPAASQADLAELRLARGEVPPS